MRTRILAALGMAFGGTLAAMVAAPASATPITLSGAQLQDVSAGGNLVYRPGTDGTVTYTSGSPDVVALYTPDSGLNGSAPTAYVKAAGAGLASLGTLNAFSASYVLSGSTTPSGTAPYWLTYLFDPDGLGGYVGVISFGGPDLNASSQVHLFCDFSNSGDCTTDLETSTWGDTLSTLDSIALGSTTIGQLTVYETGVEIGAWNGYDNIASSASIESLTIFPAPEPGSLLLMGTALAAVWVQRRQARPAKG